MEQINETKTPERKETSDAFIDSSKSVQILSTIARVSGGTYDSLPEIVEKWRRYRGSCARFNDPIGTQREEYIAREYLTPMLLCGKPDSIDIRRWFIKCLSNDQTAFTGFTSIVDIVDANTIGYDGQIRLLPTASFVEPFALKILDEEGKKKLLEMQQRLNQLDSTQAEEISRILKEAEQLCPITTKRKKGKSPIFFYGITNKPFQLPRKLYDRLERITEAAYNALSTATDEWEKTKSNKKTRRILTGSIDFMIFGEDVYIIDIGTPAVGYVADILAANTLLNRTPDIGADKIRATLNSSITIPQNTLSRELGFFKLEREYLIKTLRELGIIVDEIDDETCEAIVNDTKLPNQTFDYLSRNQPLRNKILQQSEELAALGAKIPESFTGQPDDFWLARFYEATRLGNMDLGLLIKKKVFFKEYETGRTYFKPLVVPIWSRELRADKMRSNLMEQFIPSLIETDIAGDKKGKRCCEIRMYFVAGDSK